MTCAALAQLKNCIRSYWFESDYNPNHKMISVIDKSFFIDNIPKLIWELIDSRKYSKLVKDILSIIGPNTYLD